MNIIYMRAKVTAFILGSIFLISATPALAISTATFTARPTGLPIQAQNRLNSGRLRACQARENAIKQRTNHLVELVTIMESKFDAIASRVEKYYTDKVVPGGKNVANYTTLTNDIQTKKAAVQVALTKAQTDSASFSCKGDGPRELLLQFRLDMQSVIGALKDYRTSIRNLIVAIHSVTGETESTKPSASPL